MPDSSNATTAAARAGGQETELQALGRDLLAAAYLERDFLLSSGQHSNYYLDKYLFETRPDILRRIARSLAPLVPEGTQRLPDRSWVRWPWRRRSRWSATCRS